MNRMIKAITKSFLGLMVLGLILSTINVSFATQETSHAKVQDESNKIIYDASVYSEELEYVKLCLNNLEFTDYKDRKLTINGYFDQEVEFALSNFLKSQKFEYFNEHITYYKRIDKNIREIETIMSREKFNSLYKKINSILK